LAGTRFDGGEPQERTHSNDKGEKVKSVSKMWKGGRGGAFDDFLTFTTTQLSLDVGLNTSACAAASLRRLEVTPVQRVTPGTTEKHD
jgi:hypothetical protein